MSVNSYLIRNYCIDNKKILSAIKMAWKENHKNLIKKSNKNRIVFQMPKCNVDDLIKLFNNSNSVAFHQYLYSVRASVSFSCHEISTLYKKSRNDIEQCLTNRIEQTFKPSSCDKKRLKYDLDNFCARVVSFLNSIRPIDCASVVIDFNMEAFHKLGSYVADKGSCFGPLGCNRYHKYKLMLMPESFVCLVRNNRGKEIIRFFGFVDFQNKSIGFTNFYCCGAASTRDVIYPIILSLLGKHLFKSPNTKYYKKEPLRTSGVYNNRDGYKAYFDKIQFAIRGPKPTITGIIKKHKLANGSKQKSR